MSFEINEEVLRQGIESVAKQFNDTAIAINKVLECLDKNVGKISNAQPSYRPNKHEYYLDIALAVAQRSTCLRSAYGAVIVLDDRIVSTGYNGSRSGTKNCCDENKCMRDGAVSRTSYENCPAVHAEQNAIIRRRVGSIEGSTLYLSGFSRITGERKTGSNSFPCKNCCIMAVQAGIQTIVVKSISNVGYLDGPIDYWTMITGV
jgi:dCMP deaminase